MCVCVYIFGIPKPYPPAAGTRPIAMWWGVTNKVMMVKCHSHMLELEFGQQSY